MGGRCGVDEFGKAYPSEDWDLGACDFSARKNEVGPCCSKFGWCGDSPTHCDCAGCVDYRDKFELVETKPCKTLSCSRNYGAHPYPKAFSGGRSLRTTRQNPY